MDKKPSKNKIKEFWLKYEAKVVLILAFILVAAISFEGGILKGQKMPQNPIIIEKPVESNVPNQNAPEGQNLPSEEKKTTPGPNIPDQSCAYIGSKNSDKYHLPTCPYAKRIKPENRTCFSSPDEAKSKGYVPDSNCIK